MEIRGIPYQDREDTNQIVVKIMQQLNIELKSKDISISHRLATNRQTRQQSNRRGDSDRNDPAIIVKFTRRDVSDKLYSSKKYLYEIKQREALE